MQFESALRERHRSWIARESDRIAAQVASSERPGAATASRDGGFEIEYLPYGPGNEQGEPTCEIVASYGRVEPEYAAIRRGVGLLDAPHRAVIEIVGADRLSFLDSMITQAVGSLAPGEVRRSFWLERTGRIVSDLVVANLEDRCLLEVDVHAAARTVETLDNYLFAEDAAIEWTPGSLVQLRLHGPASLAVLTDLLEEGTPPGTDAVTTGRLAGGPVTLLRCDETGEPGVALIVDRARAESVWDALTAWTGASDARVRPVGWSAWNAARIEAGVPVFNIDFGSDALPAETGVLEDRVSFNKGCYLGQEIVARIHSLGQPKQRLVALDLGDDGLPVAGAQVFARSETPDGTPGFGPQIGGVTSSTLSPMLGARPIALAMIRTEQSETGTRVLLTAEGEPQDGTVRDGLSFLPGSDS